MAALGRFSGTTSGSLEGKSFLFMVRDERGLSLCRNLPSFSATFGGFFPFERKLRKKYVPFLLLTSLLSKLVRTVLVCERKAENMSVVRLNTNYKTESGRAMATGLEGNLYGKYHCVRYEKEEGGAVQHLKLGVSFRETKSKKEALKIWAQKAGVVFSDGCAVSCA